MQKAELNIFIEKFSIHIRFCQQRKNCTTLTFFCEKAFSIKSYEKTRDMINNFFSVKYCSIGVLPAMSVIPFGRMIILTVNGLFFIVTIAEGK